MSTYKRVDNDYNIISISPESGDNVNITTHTVNITGNLAVVGNVTYIHSEDLIVDDPFITVAGNNTGNIGTAVFQTQGMVAQSSSTTYAGIRFNNGTLNWEISPSVDANGAPITSYAEIGTASAGAPGTPANSVQFNSSNTFAGDAAFVWDNTGKKLTIQGTLGLGNVGTPPSAVANTAILYHNAIGSGGSGVYAITATDDVELVSKSKAIVYAIIF